MAHITGVRVDFDSSSDLDDHRCRRCESCDEVGTHERTRGSTRQRHDNIAGNRRCAAIAEWMTQVASCSGLDGCGQRGTLNLS